MSGNSYCVDWFTVRHQSSNGAVIMEQIEKVSSYSFEWNRELNAVTVEASNSLGSSTNNINMTLDSQPKREWEGRLPERVGNNPQSWFIVILAY